MFNKISFVSSCLCGNFTGTLRKIGWVRSARKIISRELTSSMAKQKDDKPFTVRCPNCQQAGEPDFNETTRRYACAICAFPVDAQVIIEKKRRGIK